MHNQQKLQEDKKNRQVKKVITEEKFLEMSESSCFKIIQSWGNPNICGEAQEGKSL